MLHARRHFALALLASTVLIFVLGQDRYQYVRHVKGCVDASSNRGLRYQSKTQSECAALCDAYGNGCKGFEFGVAYGGSWQGYDPGDCLLQSSDFNVYRRKWVGQYDTEESGCKGAYYNLDFYTKDSNAPMTTTWTFTTIQQPEDVYDNDDDISIVTLFYSAVGIAVFICILFYVRRSFCVYAIKVRRSLKRGLYLITKPTLIPFSRRE
jgi:hypothetical protein